jgi:hypothetical protein
MSTDRVVASIALTVAAFALAISAWSFTNDDRDACAKLADLGTGVGVETAFRITGNEESGEGLLEDCLTE